MDWLKFFGGRFELRIEYGTMRLAVLAAAYVALLAVGVWVGFAFEHYTDFADALLFAVTNYTTVSQWRHVLVLRACRPVGGWVVGAVGHVSACRGCAATRADVTDPP